MVPSTELAKRTSDIGGNVSSAWIATESKAIATDANMTIRRKPQHLFMLADNAGLIGAPPVAAPTTVESIEYRQSVECDM
jgi:hypothetical protein